MNPPRLWAVVPVKPFAAAKERLAPFLSPHERATLARTMQEDVLQALTRSTCLAGVLVVTRDAAAAAIAREAGADVMAEGPDSGMSSAVRHASRALAAARAAGMLMVPADVPLIERSDIEALAAGHGGVPAVTLVAATRDGGTNALVLSPPDALAISFGADSYRRHRAAALGSGIAPVSLSLARVERDIDRPEDLWTLVVDRTATRTRAYLRRSGIAWRLRAADVGPSADRDGHATNSTAPGFAMVQRGAISP